VSIFFAALLGLGGLSEPLHRVQNNINFVHAWVIPIIADIADGIISPGVKRSISARLAIQNSNGHNHAKTTDRGVIIARRENLPLAHVIPVLRIDWGTRESLFSHGFEEVTSDIFFPVFLTGIHKDHINFGKDGGRLPKVFHFYFDSSRAPVRRPVISINSMHDSLSRWSNSEPRADGIHRKKILLLHRVGGVTGILDGSARQDNLPKKKTGSDSGYSDTDSSDDERPKSPKRSTLLREQITFLALIFIPGFGIGCYGLSQIGKSRSVGINLLWASLFGIGCAICGPAALMLVMAMS